MRMLNTFKSILLGLLTTNPWLLNNQCCQATAFVSAQVQGIRYIEETVSTENLLILAVK